MADVSTCRVAVKLSVHLVALTALAACTIMLVSEAPYILEEDGGIDTFLTQDTVQGAMEMGAARGADTRGLKGDSDDLFDMLTSPETPVEAHEVQTNGVQRHTAGHTRAHHSERHAAIPTTELTIDEPSTDDVGSGAECTERGPPLCRTVSATCVKRGPSCQYEKMCIAKDDSCIPDGICMQPQRKCHPVFPKACVECAKTNAACRHAHTVANQCVSQCEGTCMKDALCEQKCASGCLKKYEGFMESCKRDCKPCQAGGNKQTCYDSCSNWKQCQESVNRCVMENECLKEGKKCSFKTECLEHEQHCAPVQKCAEQGNECKQTTHCLIRDTKCTHEPTTQCTACRSNTTACQGEDKVKKACHGDCKLQCAKSKPELQQACLDECSKGCHTSEEALNKLCNAHCPACKTPDPACHLKCLKEEKKQECKKVCKKHETVQECKPVCTKHKQVKHCVEHCESWKQKKKCQKHCQKWAFSATRPCRHRCKEHGFERVCHHDKTTCVAWSGGKVCDKVGPCISWKKPTQSSNLDVANNTQPADTGDTDSDTVVAGTIVTPDGATTTPGQQPASVPLSPGPVIVGDSHNSTVLQTGGQYMPAGWAQPISNDSKIGKVMAQATDDVERLLGGKPTAEGTKNAKTGTTKTHKKSANIKSTKKKGTTTALEETPNGAHESHQAPNSGDTDRDAIMAAAKSARESLLAAQQELSAAEEEETTVYQPSAAKKPAKPDRSSSNTMASQGWQEVVDEEPMASSAAAMANEAARQLMEAQRQEQAYIARTQAAAMQSVP